MSVGLSRGLTTQQTIIENYLNELKIIRNFF